MICKVGGKFSEEKSNAQMDLREHLRQFDYFRLSGRKISVFFLFLFALAALGRFSHNNTVSNSYGRINNDKFSKCFKPSVNLQSPSIDFILR